MKTNTTLKTLDDFLSGLDAQGITVTEWARSRGFPARSVYAVISGHHTGTRGKARAVLTAMGIEPPPSHPTLQRERAAATSTGSFLWRRSPPQVVTLKPRYRLHIDGSVELVSAGARA